MNFSSPTASSDMSGRDVIRRIWATLPKLPGVYHMLDQAGRSLYIGKAKHLKHRVGHYLQAGLNARLEKMVSLTASMEIITTRSEAEAFLLEANLIKKRMPRYNILLRDDKSFPYIAFSGDHPFPRVSKYRGTTTGAGRFFGPFVSAHAVDETLAMLQKAFLLRPCSDSVFSHRTRPCLQYQIKRCSAPCVGYIREEEYADLLAQAEDFLQGKSHEVEQQLMQQMERLSDAMRFEQAALLRDRIRALRQIQQGQTITARITGDLDVIALAKDRGRSCLQIFSFRGGHNYGSKCFFPEHTADCSESEIITGFIGQFYQKHPIPPVILVSHALEEHGVVEKALAAQADRRVQILLPVKGGKREALLHAQQNAETSLARHLSLEATQYQLIERLCTLFRIQNRIARIEVYDNSHVQGTHAVGAMIVAGPQGFMKQAYRVFRIQRVDTVPGDDYAMMREVLLRRFRAFHEEAGEKNWPDLVLIDGGAEHLKLACDVFETLGIKDLPLAAIAKGVDRNAGREWIHVPGMDPFQLPVDDPVLHYLQRLRDEAHRFAIGTHRNQRSKALQRSALDEIPSIGAVRKRALLQYFGSVRALSGAAVDDIAHVPGVSQKLAQLIYDHLHR